MGERGENNLAKESLRTFAETETSAHDGSIQTLTQHARKLETQGYFSRFRSAVKLGYDPRLKRCSNIAAASGRGGLIHYLSAISPVTCSCCMASSAALLPAKTLTQRCSDCERIRSHFLLISREIKLRLVERPGVALSMRNWSGKKANGRMGEKSLKYCKAELIFQHWAVTRF